MKHASTTPQSAPERTNSDGKSSDDHAPLPHEADQNVESQNDHEPRDVGKQAHDDMQRGLVDTDRRGGGDYQRGTQRDEHVNINSDEKDAQPGKKR